MPFRWLDSLEDAARQGVVPERYRGRVCEDESGCWVWTGSRLRTGYGHCMVGRRQKMAHRVIYEILAGAIPAGLQLDHLCRNRACVNPAHLEPVTATENKRRGFSPAAIHARKTHCPRGHAYTADNTYHRPGGPRRCRICTLANNAAGARRRLAKAKENPANAV